MGAGDLSFAFAVVATGASVAVLLAFGFIRRREAIAWDTGRGGGPAGNTVAAGAAQFRGKIVLQHKGRGQRAAEIDAGEPGVGAVHVNGSQAAV